MEEEGVTKFNLNFEKRRIEPCEYFDSLLEWRNILHHAVLVGQIKHLYGGAGYGNVSCRIPPYDSPTGQRAFMITGTQTSGHQDVSIDDYALISEYSTEKNLIVAYGVTPPSSESLTHAAVYDIDPLIHFVFHVHTPQIWSSSRELGIPTTDPSVPYGTPQMAQEIMRVHDGSNICAMGGHKDGIITYGATPYEAGITLFQYMFALEVPGWEPPW